MPGSGTLELLAQLVVTVVGFSGVVAVLGRRAFGEWAELDRLRFRAMVHTAVVVLALCLLPLFLHGAGFVDSMVWGWSSGIGAAICALLLVPQLRDISRGAPWSTAAVSKPALALVVSTGLGAPLLLGLNAAGLVFERTLTPYLLSCLLLFGTSVVLFLRLLESEVGRKGRAA